MTQNFKCSQIISLEDSILLKYYRSLSIFVIVFGHTGGFWFYEPYSSFLLTVNAVFFFISGSVSIFSSTKWKTYKMFVLDRYISLLIPYYLLCLISLLVYIVNNHSIPDFNFDYLLKWLTMRPSNQIMPFPIGQIWWLQTLLLITLWAPLFFWLNNTKEKYNWLIIVFCLFLSTVQLFSNEKMNISFIGFYLYNASFYSAFFIFGLFFTTKKKYFIKPLLALYIIVGLSGCLMLIYTFDLNISYAIHCFPPNLYYALGSLSLIGSMLLTKKCFIQIINRYKFISIVLLFFYKHTFSIFLLHTFSIYFCENYLWFILPEEKNMLYALIKFISVLIITCLLSIPFTAISKQLITRIVSYMKPLVNKSL